jgi:hypothetical protein
LNPRSRASDLLGGSLSDAISWQRSQCGRLEEVAAFTRAVSEAVGKGFTCSQARHLVSLRSEAEVAHDRLAACAADFGDTFGDLYDGSRTDMTTIRLALEWARLLRVRGTATDGPLTPEQVKAIGTAVPTANLAAAATAWDEASKALASAFDLDRRQELVAELDEYDEAADLIETVAVKLDETSGYSCCLW